MSDHQTRQREAREAKRLKREQQESVEAAKAEERQRAFYQVDAEIPPDVMLQLLIDNLHLPEDAESISVVERRHGNFVFIARRRRSILDGKT